MNKLLKCPKFEKKFDRKCTANFCFCPSLVSHNLGRKNQMIREISSHCDKNSAHNVGGKYRWKPLIFFSCNPFPAKLWLTFEGQKQKFAVRSRSNFFSNFGHFSSSFNPVFYFHFKNINFFEIGPKLTFLRCFFHGTIFFAEEFLLS